MYDDYDGLLGRLERWSRERGTFHGDRALADEVMIADGWEFFEDHSFEDGRGWKHGAGPTVLVSHPRRPHAVNDLNAALGVVPFGYGWRLLMPHGGGGRAFASVTGPAGSEAFEGESCSPCVAVLIAAVKALRARALAGRIPTAERQGARASG